jgi:spore coat protein A
MLKLSAIGAAGLFLPVDHAPPTNRTGAAPFQQPLRVPAVLTPTRQDAATDYYEIDMRAGQIEILPGKLTTIWGYNGSFPGPTIKARSGRKVIVRQRNHLSVETTIHLHGGHVAPEDDGGPLDGIAPGGYRDYTYPNAQRAATLWYHDHAMHTTARNLYMGLAGFYLIEDAFERGLNLPSGEHDVPLMLQDRLFNGDGSLNFPTRSHDGINGDTILVNGAPQPYFQVANRRYRFRILNASNSRQYELALDSAQPLIQIASDGGLLRKPARRATIPLAPAERVEIVLDFSRAALGSRIILNNKLGRGNTAEIMCFDVAHRIADGSALPEVLRPIAPLSGAASTRDFALSMDHESGTWVINGKSFDPQRIDARPKLGSTEIWRIMNHSEVPHPFHPHLVMFQILDRDGVKPAAGEDGWKDTVNVQPAETVQVIAKFGDYAGKYLFHCHNLQHEDHMMMGQFEVVPTIPKRYWWRSS